MEEKTTHKEKLEAFDAFLEQFETETLVLEMYSGPERRFRHTLATTKEEIKKSVEGYLQSGLKIGDFKGNEIPCLHTDGSHLIAVVMKERRKTSRTVPASAEKRQPEVSQ